MADDKPAEDPADEPAGDGLDGLDDAVEEALDPVRREAIMRVWRDVTMQSVETVRPPRDDDDPVRRLYDLTDPDEPS